MTNDEYMASIQQCQERFVRIDLMDRNNRVLDKLEGVAIDGNISLDGTETKRRSCDLTMHLIDNSILPSPSSKIWLNKRFRLSVGITNILTGEIQWFDKGIYLFDEPNLRYSATERTISIKGADLYCNLDGTFNGDLKLITTINADTPLFDALKVTANLMEQNVVINDTDSLKVPYQIKEEANSNVGSLLNKLKELYMGFELSYDEKAWLIFQRIKDRSYDPITFDFTGHRLVVDYSNSPDWKNIRNEIVVYGMQLENGTQIKYSIQNNDSNNPFSIANLGDTRTMVVSDDKTQTQAQAQLRAEYELWKHSSLNEKVNFNCVPIYGLEPNTLVKLDVPEVGIQGNYLVNRINLPLDVEGTMSVECIKMYY